MSRPLEEILEEATGGFDNPVARKFAGMLREAFASGAAAERERIIQLAADVGATYVFSFTSTDSGLFANHPFAELLEDTP